MADDVLTTLAALAGERLPSLIADSEYAGLPVYEQRPMRRYDPLNEEDPAVAEALDAIRRDKVLRNSSRPIVACS